MRKKRFGRATAALLGAAAIAVSAPAVGASATTTGSPAYLQSGQQLQPGQSLTSGESSLVMQADGNLVLYLLGPDGNHGPALWSSGTYGNWGAYAYMQSDGNFVVYRHGGPSASGALWSSRTWNHPDSFVELLDGSLFVTNPHDGSGWQSHTQFQQAITPMAGLASGDVIESNSVWLVMQSDGNLVLYRKRDGAALWSTRTWNHPGATAMMDSGGSGFLGVYDWGRGWIWSNGVSGHAGATAKLQNDGNFVIYAGNGTPLWSTGTWGNW
ncbi:hypothetical protein LN042_14750 [Kitasatospora sp. RB6PN24]|uniref:hypothetical protein n=1 Tax=Kitasatospora humi TaxID=2893891 RepID=UPI001E30F46E|nr:hypothetical protein [Kitasatospora humi]MCC9308333.1 hypothetical protein [Kitasatospora humi]